MENLIRDTTTEYQIECYIRNQYHAPKWMAFKYDKPNNIVYLRSKHRYEWRSAYLPFILDTAKVKLFTDY